MGLLEALLHFNPTKLCDSKKTKELSLLLPWKYDSETNFFYLCLRNLVMLKCFKTQANKSQQLAKPQTLFNASSWRTDCIFFFNWVPHPRQWNLSVVKETALKWMFSLVIHLLHCKTVNDLFDVSSQQTSVLIFRIYLWQLYRLGDAA